MSQPRTFKSYSTAFKLEAITRMEAGARKAVLATELGVPRKLLYQWHDSWKASGAAGLNRKRGPKPGGGRKPPSDRPPDHPPDRDAANL